MSFFIKLLANNKLFILGTATMITFLFMSFGSEMGVSFKQQSYSFVERVGTQFVLDGKPFYINGWNSYWMMDHAASEKTRSKVIQVLQQAPKMGLTVCRTWAFNDGAYHALQLSPGQFDELSFRALDFVIAEARRNGVRLILSLVNNLEDYGGKTQYVKWAWKEGVGLSSSNDSFFSDPSIMAYFKDYIKAVLTRKNTITGIAYRDDPIILAWELINEPRCMSDPSGDTLQDWIKEMSQYIKSIDEKHLVTIGLEGFYGANSAKSDINPSEWKASTGTDFIRNTEIPTIDFASFHLYPDKWLTDDLDEKLEFTKKWLSAHIEDGDKKLKKPVLLTEFGLSSSSKDFEDSHREKFVKVVYDSVYKSAKRNKAGAGALLWQLVVKGMEDYNDDYGIIPQESRSTFELVSGQSCRLATLPGHSELKGTLSGSCRPTA